MEILSSRSLTWTGEIYEEKFKNLCFVCFISVRSSMSQVVSGLHRLDPSSGRVSVSVEDTIKIVQDLT